jgi:hypothetical protein
MFSLLNVFFLMTTVGHAGTTGPPDVCQTDGPVRVCDENGFGVSYSVSYNGYLVGDAQLQPCRPDYSAESDIRLGGSVNGAPFSDSNLYAFCGNAGTGQVGIPPDPIQSLGDGFDGAGEQPTSIELYFYDPSGHYDSVYGQNYRFEFPH